MATWTASPGPRVSARACFTRKPLEHRLVRGDPAPPFSGVLVVSRRKGELIGRRTHPRRRGQRARGRGGSAPEFLSPSWSRQASSLDPGTKLVCPLCPRSKSSSVRTQFERGRGVVFAASSAILSRDPLVFSTPEELLDDFHGWRLTRRPGGGVLSCLVAGCLEHDGGVAARFPR